MAQRGRILHAFDSRRCLYGHRILHEAVCRRKAESYHCRESVVIASGNNGAAMVVGVEMLELFKKEGCLHFVYAGVNPFQIMDVLLF